MKATIQLLMATVLATFVFSTHADVKPVTTACMHSATQLRNSNLNLDKGSLEGSFAVEHCVMANQSQMTSADGEAVSGMIIKWAIETDSMVDTQILRDTAIRIYNLLREQS